jgi:alkanesulfonate monooxygenase SsuD/methylene tetrahydromethanopterin reductase-like flavin-dependent oxidoreductase (luciferase family)
MPTPVGLNVWSRLVADTFPDLDRAAAGFESLWFPDHVQYEAHKVAEGWSLLAFALGRYPDKISGHTVLCNSFRNPALLAKMAATAQALSGGRVVLGIGAGWNEEEYRAYGWPFPDSRTRIAQMVEAIELIRLMWTEAPASYQGQHYQIAGAYCEPRPDPIPPIMIGGAGEKYLLRAVAQYADWWNFVFTDLAAYAHKLAVLQEHCRAVGRDYDEIEQSIQLGVLIAETEDDLRRLKEQPHVRPLESGAIGTPEQVAETLLGIVKQGADRLMLHFADAPHTEGTQLFAATVLPHLAQ